MFLQDIRQFSAERNLTYVVEEDRHGSARQVHHPGDADEITKLDDSRHEQNQFITKKFVRVKMKYVVKDIDQNTEPVDQVGSSVPLK